MAVLVRKINNTPKCTITHALSTVANLAGVQFADVNPTGYTFGAPSVFRAGASCNAINPKDWYRFVNSVDSQHRRAYGSEINPEIGLLPGGLVWDNVPLSYDTVPQRNYKNADHAGYLLILSQEFTIANIGLSSQMRFTLLYETAGRMTIKNFDKTNAGYLDRLVSIRDYYTTESAFPVPFGYFKNDLCTRDAECAEGTRCIQSCPIVCPPRCNIPE